MNTHLSDEQWAAAILHEHDASTMDHLAGCPTCREEVRLFAAAAGVAQDQARRAAERPEAFWRQRREGLSARMPAFDIRHPGRRWIWVTATIMVILLASTLLSRNAAPPVPIEAQTDPDDALLLSVQQSIRSDLPQALRPAALLTQEIDRAATSRRNP